MVELAVASKNWIIEAPQNGEFLAVIYLCKKGIEIKISNQKNLFWSKGNFRIRKRLYIHDKNLEKYQKNTKTTYTLITENILTQSANMGHFEHTAYFRPTPVEEKLTMLNALHCVEHY